jgi:hypothetical protein
VTAPAFAPAAGVTLRQRLLQRLGDMKRERFSFESHWRDLSDFILPRRARFLFSDKNRGEKVNQRVLDNTGTLAVRTTASGMMAGLTSPARNWFRLTTPDPELNELADVKQWLFTTELRLREVFNRSNLYSTLPQHYQDLTVFGTSAFHILEDDEDVIRCQHWPVGTYYLANSDRMAVDTAYRLFPLTVRQVVTQFGRQPDGTIDWSGISRPVRNLWENRSYDEWVEVLHAIEPNDGAPRAMQGRRVGSEKPYRSVYLETQGAEEKLLKESGFEEFPVIASRWSLIDSDIYGSSPGMDALGDIKALQLMQRRKSQAVDKLVNPPWNAPASLRRGRARTLPGDINYVDATVANQGLQPAYVIKPELAALTEDIRENQDRINRAFYVDLFQMLTMSDRRQITAREIDERHEEKLLMLGPVLERLNGEQNDPLIDRTFAIMMREGLLGDPPEHVQGIDIRVEYISMLAQAQRAVGTGGMERLTGFTLQLAQADPSVLDKLDFDQTVDEYAEMLGVPPKVVRADDEVEAVRAQKAKQQQMAMAAATAAPIAKAAKDASETQMGGDTALSRLLGQSGPGQQLGQASAVPATGIPGLTA